MTWDELKLQRDGHLEYGKVPSSRHAWVVPVHCIVEVTATSVFTTLGDGRGIIEWARASAGSA